MNNYFLSFLFTLLFIPFSQAQFGVSGQVLSYPLQSWEEKIDANFHDLSIGGSIDYWMRLKNYRWEMVPTFSFNTAPNERAEGFLEGRDLQMSAYKFHFKNNIYILDFKNDCDCPTFSKQSGWFQKSFFLQVAPGYSYHRLEIKPIEVGNLHQENIHLFEIGLGAGFDFGLSDLITISPYFNYVATANSFVQLNPIAEQTKSNMNHYLFGIRLGFRPDYARPSYRSKRARRMFK